MVNNNNNLIIENKKAQIEEVRYLDNQVEEKSKVTKLVTFLGMSKVECVKDKGTGGGSGGAGGVGGGGPSKKEIKTSSGGGGGRKWLGSKYEPDWEPKIVQAETPKSYPSKAKDPEECKIL